MTVPRTSLALCLVIVLVTAGCTIAEKNLSAGSETARIMLSPTDTQTSPTPYERITKKVIPQPHPRADYFRMLKDIWEQGNEISITFVNDGTETISCRNTQPEFIVYRHLENGTEIPVRTYPPIVQPAVSYIRPGEGSFHYKISTGDLDPGRYSLWTDCGGGIYREFFILPSRIVNVTVTGS